MSARSRFYDWAMRQADIDPKIASKAKPYVMGYSDYKAKTASKFWNAVSSTLGGKNGTSSAKRVRSSNRSRAGKPKTMTRQRRRVRSYHTAARTGQRLIKRQKTYSRKKSLVKRVAALEKSKVKQAKKSYRNIDSYSHSHASNLCDYSEFAGIDTGIIEAAIDSLPFIDRAATPAEDAIDYTSIGLQVNLRIQNIYSKVTLKNNYETPVMVDLYCLVVKQDNSFGGVEAAMLASDEQRKVVDAGTNILTYPSDFSQFVKNYAIVKHQKGMLNSGDEMVMTWTKKSLKYDPEDIDDASSTDHKGDQVWFLRTYGCVAHDATTDTNVGTGSGQLDIITLRKFECVYDGDAPFETIETQNSLSGISTTETGGPSVNNDHQN